MTNITWYQKAQNEQAKRDKTAAIDILFRDMEKANTEFIARRQEIERNFAGLIV